MGSRRKCRMCQCGCGERTRPGRRFVHGHNQRRLLGEMGVTNPTGAKREWKIFDAGKLLGSISDPRPYDAFDDQQSALMWWFSNREKFMGERCQAYLSDSFLCPGDRGTIFWEIEFGCYPKGTEEILLIESHALWYPGERQKFVFHGGEIPKIKKCELHAFGWPITFPKPEERVVKIVDGELLLGIHEECEAVAKILEQRCSLFKNQTAVEVR